MLRPSRDETLERHRTLILFMEATARQIPAEKNPAGELLEFFYPIHYQIEMALEDALRGGALTRKQAAILWLIRSEGDGSRRMKRKDIERLMQGWFEVSSSAISKAIRGMARAPLALVQITEDPQSGREKLISLTPKGERFLSAMVTRGEEFLQHIVEQLPTELVHHGIEFLGQTTETFRRVHTSRQLRAVHAGKMGKRVKERTGC